MSGVEVVVVVVCLCYLFLFTLQAAFCAISEGVESCQLRLKAFNERQKTYF